MSKKSRTALITAGIIILLLGGYLLFRYLTDREEVVLNLQPDTVYLYNGVFESKGNQKTISMAAPEHKIVVERVFEENGEKQFHLAFYAADQRMSAMVLMENAEGVFVVAGSKKILAIPRTVKRNQKWQFMYANNTIDAVAGPRTKMKTPRGTASGRELLFQSQERTRIKVLIDREKGITGIHYSYIAEGASRSEANLVLTGTEKRESR